MLGIIEASFTVRATVLEVDILRNKCKCVTEEGQVMTNVGWIEYSGGNGKQGSFHTPRFNDKVIIVNSLGYPLIIGSDSDPYENVSYNKPRIDHSKEHDVLSAGDFSMFFKEDLRVNKAQPSDAYSGDHILSNDEGSLLGILNSGSILAKASTLAQIFVSKWDDLVRVVARNLEVFTDVSTTVERNEGNNIYSFTGYAKTHKDVREERYHYFESRGDAYLGSKVEADYHTKNIQSIADGKPTPWPIRMYGVREFDENTDVGYNENHYYRMKETLNLDGSLERINTNKEGDVKATYFINEATFSRQLLDPGATSYTYQYSNEFHTFVDKDGKTNTWTWNEDGTELDWNGQALIRKNSSGITIDWKGQDTITLTDSSITLNRNGVSKVILTDSSTTAESNGRKMIINASGIHFS